jgi:hypothetical protein
MSPEPDLRHCPRRPSTTDTFTQIRLGALPPDATVRLDGEPTGPLVQVPVGRHTITLTTTSVRSAALVPLSAIAARR